MLCRGCICTIYDRINEVTNHPLLQYGEGKKENMIMTLMDLQKEIVSMIAKCGSETLVVRTDSQTWIKDIKCLKHANIDGKEMVIIN